MATADNVSTGKPKVGGAIFCAPVGTPLPTSAGATLDEEFKALGFVSEDGLTNSDSREFNDFNAWGGDHVHSQMSKRTDAFKFKLIEALNPDVLAVVYGSDNVSGTLATGITVKANSNVHPSLSWVVDMVMTNGVAKRIVIPSASVTTVSDIVYKDTDLIGYETTITATPDSDGNTHYEYIKEASA